MQVPKKKLRLFYVNFILVVLLFLAIFTRFFHLFQTFEWGADNTRDFLVAKHIVEDYDFKWIAPWSFGSSNKMANSVFYYYLIASFYLLSFGNLFIYQLLFSLFFFVIILVFSYLFGKLFFKEKSLQYLTALFFCILPIMNVYGRGIFQPHFIFPFFMISLYYFFSAFQKKSIKRLSLATFFYSVTLNIHYSVLVLLPWVLGMIIYLQYSFYSKKDNNFEWKTLLVSQLNWPSLIIFLNFAFLLINQFIIKGFNSGLTFLNLFLYNTFFTNLKFYFRNLSDNLHVFGDNLTGFNNTPILLFTFYLLIFFIFYLFFTKKKTFYSYSLFLAVLCFFFVFFIVYYNGTLNYPSYYFTPFYIILPLFLLSVLASLSKKLCNFLFVLFFINVAFFSYQHFVTKIKVISNQKDINKYQLIANKISDDIKNNLINQNDFFIFTINDQLDWSSAPYWLYLENSLNLPLVKNTSYRYNIIPSNESSKNVYLICDNPRIGWDKVKGSYCLERFVNKGFLRSYEEIYSLKNVNLHVYRLSLNKEIDYYYFYNMSL